MRRFFLKAFLLLMLFALALPSRASPARSWPDCHWGSRDSGTDAGTYTVQSLLNARGYPVFNDGVFGRKTEKALKKFQHDHHLVQTGTTNTPTWEALVVTLHKGSTGPEVIAAQRLLDRAGYDLANDGIFGAEMLADVKKYQSQTGHSADGIIGLYTWCELVGGSAGEQGD